MGRTGRIVQIMPKTSDKDRERIEKEIENLTKKAETAKEKEDYSKAVIIYQEMARLAGSIEDKRAVDFCMEAARYSIKMGDDFKAGWSYKCAADHSLTFEDFNNTINFAMKAIKHFSRSDSMYIVQWCYNLIGEASEKIKDYELALKSYKKSLEIEYSKEIDEKIKYLMETISKKMGKEKK